MGQEALFPGSMEIVPSNTLFDGNNAQEASYTKLELIVSLGEEYDFI